MRKISTSLRILLPAALVAALSAGCCESLSSVMIFSYGSDDDSAAADDDTAGDAGGLQHLVGEPAGQLVAQGQGDGVGGAAVHVGRALALPQADCSGTLRHSLMAPIPGAGWRRPRPQPPSWHS